MIELQRVSKNFDDKLVLDDISIRLESGKTHILLGLSGSGKSTILRLIMGLIPVSQGSIQIDGRSLHRISKSELGRIFGFVLQKSALFPHLTAKENVLLPARIHKIKESEVSDRIRYLADLLHLEASLLDKFPFQLSGGQQQRISVMRALLLDPPYLLMDESLSALDPIIRSDLQEQMKQIFAELKKTVVFVTHDLREAHYLGDHIYLLHHGRIIQSGSFNELKENPADAFVKKFVSSQLDF